MAEFVFPGAYGGAVKSETPPQIHDLVKKLRREVGSLAAKKQPGGPMFAVRGAKELAQKVAEALDSLNMVAYPVSQEVHHLDPNVPGNATSSGKPVFRTLVHVKTTVRVVAPDTSFMDVVGSGHGGDVDDKAGGKADTYAWKNALLKGLTIPDSDMVDTDDEQPSERGPRLVTNPKPAASSPAEGNSKPAGTNGEASAPSDAKGLAYVLAEIEKADTEAALEAIKRAIASGVLAIHGNDRLTASSAWVARRDDLKKKAK